MITGFGLDDFQNGQRGHRRFLVFAWALVYWFPAFFRVLRMAGDEKVYVAQAIEMARRGAWFLQTHADEPSYFKGPFHYWLIRLGHLVFGNQIYAGVWMHGALLLLVALMTYEFGRKMKEGLFALVLSVGTLLCSGLYTHALASQMEVEVAALAFLSALSLGMWAKTKAGKYELGFWILTGILGWIKSPLHAVLQSFGGFIFYVLIDEWRPLFGLTQKTSNLRVSKEGGLEPKLNHQKVRRAFQFWGCVVLGVFVGISAYLPALLLDFKNFWETYVLREHYIKPPNGRTWMYIVLPLLHFCLPLTPIVLFGIWTAGGKLFSTVKEKGWRFDSYFSTIPEKLGFAFSVPLILFWCQVRYKGQNYALPQVLPLWMWAASVIPASFFVGSTIGFWNLKRFSRLFVPFLIFWIPALCFLKFGFHGTEWWGLHWWCLSFFGAVVALIVLWKTRTFVSYAVGSVFLFFSISATLIPLGERELIDLKENLPGKVSDNQLSRHLEEAEGSRARIYYYNLERALFSEWGLIQFAAHAEIMAWNRKDQNSEVFKKGNLILIHKPEEWEAFQKVVSEENQKRSANPRDPVVRFEIIPWKRWLTKGKGASGRSVWLEWFQSRDWKVLEKEVWIVKILD